MRLEHLLSGARREKQKRSGPQTTQAQSRGAQSAHGPGDRRFQKTESRDRAQALTETVKTYRWKKSCKQEKKGLHGGLAQLARAPALHAGGHRFESVILHERDLQGEVIDMMDKQIFT